MAATDSRDSRRPAEWLARGVIMLFAVSSSRCVVILGFDPIRANIALQMSWHRRLYVVAPPPIRHGPACPGHPNQHPAVSAGPDKPGPRGVESGVQTLNTLYSTRIRLDPQSCAPKRYNP